MSLYSKTDKTSDDFEVLEEIARIGYTADSYEVYVVTDDEGDIPHFHYRKGTKGNYEFHTCIKFETAEYCHHTGDEDVLNEEQKKNLQAFLEQPNPDFNVNFNYTMWNYMIMVWNVNNYNIEKDNFVELDKDLPMPDYENLK